MFKLEHLADNSHEDNENFVQEHVFNINLSCHMMQ